MNRWATLALGLVAYLASVRALVYFACFSSDWFVSRTVDSGPVVLWPWAVTIDVGLLAFFALPHSLLARSGVKRALARWLPAENERSAYALVAAATLSLLMWQWRPIAIEVWHVGATAGRYVLWGLAAAGWLLAGLAMLALGHRELLGLRQPQVGLITTGVYRRLRDPIFIGFAFGIWSVPSMTLGHLLLAVGMSTYLIVGVTFERRDLVAKYGEHYTAYVEGRDPSPSLQAR